MELTEEQKERIKRNREQALQRKEEAARRKRQRQEEEEKPVRKGKDDEDIQSKEDIYLEPFEREANVSQYVTKAEAMRTYCLPEGTLQVCEFIERENPRNKKFKPMKLYHRNEIRRRAHERFGGMEGLIEERKRRETKRFQKDFEQVKEALSKTSSP